MVCGDENDEETEGNRLRNKRLRLIIFGDLTFNIELYHVLRLSSLFSVIFQAFKRIMNLRFVLDMHAPFSS